MTNDSCYMGQRMTINLPHGVMAHEITDTGGIIYFEDGTRTSWMRQGQRLHCPDWCPWHLVDWGMHHDQN